MREVAPPIGIDVHPLIYQTFMMVGFGIDSMTSEVS